jgi:hypothetical protein
MKKTGSAGKSLAPRLDVLKFRVIFCSCFLCTCGQNKMCPLFNSRYVLNAPFYCAGYVVTLTTIVLSANADVFSAFCKYTVPAHT